MLGWAHAPSFGPLVDVVARASIDSRATLRGSEQGRSSLVAGVRRCCMGVLRTEVAGSVVCQPRRGKGVDHGHWRVHPLNSPLRLLFTALPLCTSALGVCTTGRRSACFCCCTRARLPHRECTRGCVWGRRNIFNDHSHPCDLTSLVEGSANSAVERWFGIRFIYNP